MRLVLAGLALAAAVGANAHALSPVMAGSDICVQAGTLIAEPGQPAQRERTLRIRDGRIAAIEEGFANQGCATIIDQRARTVLPGLIDSHVHILFEVTPTSRLDAVTKTDSDYLVDGMAFARRTLQAGFTTVADLSGGSEAHVALRRGIAEGKIEGPRLLIAARAIAHGGHGDIHGYRPDVAVALRGARDYLCSGPEDCARAVREAVRDVQPDMIKITATGGVLSNTQAGIGQQQTDAELKAIVDTARMLGRPVAAHAHGADGINAALRAGVSSIEHGTYLDDDSIRLFKRSGAYLVPTAMAGEHVAKAAEDPASGYTEPQRAKARTVGPAMLDMLRRARAGGVKIAFGTDSGVSRHGDNARELELMVEAGFTPTQALRAATVNAADHLRLTGETGTLAPGKAADLIAVDGDPLADISVLRDVRFVMARGRVAKAE